ncbi:hypothetical protein EVG20_g7664 [Dentipellis fragilis]|uniref:ATP-dependent DNA helicase PIF1 n=1 Tax=Dentipellis fragilis TaxID=205917 RepID=A0A4Y9YC71_9AGAM|nr:hypothetical protein EVG20_g7664 [Dentipellis fragilis]
MSGLASLKRDFSTNAPIKSERDTESQAPAPSKRSKLSASVLKAIELGVATRNSGDGSSMPTTTASTSMLSQKRTFAPGQVAAAPPAKRRQLPDSWKDTGSSTSSQYSSSSYNYTSSSYSYSSSALTATTTWKKAESKPLVIPAAGKSTKAANKKPAAIFLSREQQAILQLVSEGTNVFYTGSAGTGKSVLLREIIKAMQKKYAKSPDAIAITASTGIAACNIGGVTVHSFAGIGLGIESAEDLANKIRKNKKASSRWLRTKVLIVDEVSMIDGDLFDKLARIGSILRRNIEPFGGIQVIVTGDFFQLPPVQKGNQQVKFAFEAEMWKKSVKRTIKLTKVFRQKDQEFVDMLNEMRYGTLSQKSITKFRSLSRDIIYEDGLGPTELFPRRNDVDSSNGVRMSRLRGQNKTYYATDGGTASEEQRKKLLDNFMAPESLYLAVDAQVMLIKNLDETLVNGSMGIIKRFADPASYKTEFEEAILLQEGKPSSSGKKAPTKQQSQQLWPVVEFKVPGGSREVMVLPENWKIELPNGEIQASRTQVESLLMHSVRLVTLTPVLQLPLILAWAMSIHKSQGQTLDRVKVDLAKVFEKGQAYVALSRATSLDGLQVLNFSPDKVFVHDKVRQWSASLETLDFPDGND